MLSLLLLGCLLAAVSPSRANKTSEFDWGTIEPSRDLEYTPCYDSLQCARLILPLDWLEPEDTGRTVVLAIAKLPAKVGADDAAFGGTVIANPGGPGVSGIIHVLRNGRFLQGLVDGRRYHEILSFDPRGVFHSTPAADCYGGEAERNFAMWQLHGLGPLDASSTPQLQRRRAHAQALGRRCARMDAGQSSIRAYMSTASTARDALAIVDRIELSRRKRTTRTQAETRLQLRSESDAGEARIQFFGTSYGAVLGNTILSMFPGRVHRMILDGPVVAEDYVNMDWSANLVDAPHVINYFYQACFEAGPRCALWTASDASWHATKARVDALISGLDADPQPVPDADGLETVVAGVDVRRAFMSPMYSPMEFFEGLATQLRDALQGNYTLLLRRTGLSGRVDVCSPAPPPDFPWLELVSLAVRCGDGKDVTALDIPHWRSSIQLLKDRAPDIGDLWAESTFGCSGWQIRPKYRFEGPFTSPKPDASMKSGRPSAPLLVLSTLYDPVTPLGDAKRVARGHPGSRVLLQRSVGHCAVMSSASECTKRFISEYMNTGSVPPEGTECEPDCAPWRDCPHRGMRAPR